MESTNMIYRPNTKSLVSSLLAVAACAIAGAMLTGCDTGEPLAEEPKPPEDGRPVFQWCLDGERPLGIPIEPWEHVLTNLVVASGAPGHSAQDVITTPEDDAYLVGKFAYGVVSKDLEDEWVEVYIDRCAADGEMDRLGRVQTDSDGRIALRIGERNLPPIGAYKLHFRVEGDNSITSAVLRVVPEDTKAIVVDIDGTLTTDDGELIQDVFVELFEPLLEDYVPQARGGARALTERRFLEQGYLVVYLTGRPYWLSDITRGWLDDKRMAPGHLHLTDSNEESVPDEEAVGAFKARYIEQLGNLGIEVVFAYGNAGTDIYAYDEAGVAKDSTFIVGPHAGDQGTADVGNQWVQHNRAIDHEEPVEQPFDW